tara:strand:- start:5577 stop:5969 length:393 start_codon:yes stop_codon:yes gene_type:complete
MGLGKTPESFSWYSRPLFIIPAAYYAYPRKVWHVLGFMLLLATSLFWFAAPATTDPAIRDYSLMGGGYLSVQRQQFSPSCPDPCGADIPPLDVSRLLAAQSLAGPAGDQSVRLFSISPSTQVEKSGISRP